MCGTVALFVLCLAVCYASADSQPPKKPLVLVAVGTRADVLKLSSTINWLRTYYTDLLDLQVLFSGQDSTETLLAEINVQPDYDLKLGEYASNDANIFLPKVMEAVIGVLRDSRPSAVVIRGDTTTAIAAAMAAFYCKMPLIHIDAGVRSWDMSSPHPEEFNRRAISLIATLSLVPTEYSKLNLLKDGMYPDTIVVTGSTSVDSVAEAIKPLNDEDAARLSDVVSVLSIGDSSFRKKKYVVVSIKSSSDSLIEEVARAVDKLCQRFTEFTFFVIWNKGATADDTQRENVVILSPMRHAPFLRLLQNSTIVITDSASVQLEASVFAVPSFILAENMAFTETIEAEVSQVVQPKFMAMISAAVTKLDSIRARTSKPLPQEYIRMFGDGYAGLRCACRIAMHVGIPASSLEHLACGKDNIGGQEYIFQKTKPLLDRNVIRDGGEQEASAVGAMMGLELSNHPSSLFRSYFSPGRISVVLTQYKRNTTELQLRALFSQTVLSKIDRIVIFQNEKYVDLDFLKNIDFSEEIIEQETTVSRMYLSRNRRKQKNRMNDIIEVVQSPDRNYKYHGRFALALLFDTEYTVILDDDTIPQPRWLEVSTELSKSRNAIVGPVGVIVGHDRQYYLNPPINFAVEVDYTGHSWTFKTEWLKYLWGHYVPSWEAGEDIGFSALAWMHGRVRTIMPKMSLDEYEVWGDSVVRFHHDGNESHTIPIHRHIRWPLTRYWVSIGWVPCLLRGVASICNGDKLCENLYEHFGRERDGGKELPVLATRSNRLRMLDNYITVGSSSPVVWFEDAERPKTITEENILKSRSAFAPYHVKKLRGVEVDNSDDENQRGGKRKSRRSGVESGRQMGNIRNKRRRNNGQREL